MTKQVRVENADANTGVQVVVITEDRVYDAERKVMTDEWRETSRTVLAYPTAMSSGLYLTDTRRLRIEEQSS